MNGNHRVVKFAVCYEKPRRIELEDFAVSQALFCLFISEIRTTTMGLSSMLKYMVVVVRI